MHFWVPGVILVSMDDPTAKKLFLLLQRQAGVSRRKAQELVESGEVSVNGETVDNPYLLVDPRNVDRLALRGHPLSLQLPDLRVYRFHKPPGMLCSHDDPHYGNTVGRLLRAEGFIGYSWAGRLDQDAEGLVLLTNDGELLHRLSHPRYEVAKSYQVWIQRLPKRPQMESYLRQMVAGIEDDGDRLRALSGHVEGRPPYVKLVLSEGKKHEIKRLFAHFGLQVVRLLRVSVGTVTLGPLARNAFARVAAEALQRLRSYAHRMDT